MNMGPCPVHPHFLLENHCVCCGKPVSPDVTRSLYEMAALKWDLKVHILRGGAIKMGSLSAGSPALFGHSPPPWRNLSTICTWKRTYGLWILSSWGGRRTRLPALHVVPGHWKANERDALKSPCSFGLQLYPLKNPSTCLPCFTGLRFLQCRDPVNVGDMK